MRTPVAALAVLLAATALAGCSDAPDVPIPETGPWTVAIGNEQGIGTAVPCFDDHAVSESWMTANMPSTGGGATVPADRTTQDVQRIVACIRRESPATGISVLAKP